MTQQDLSCCLCCTRWFLFLFPFPSPIFVEPFTKLTDSTRERDREREWQTSSIDMYNNDVGKKSAINL